MRNNKVKPVRRVLPGVPSSGGQRGTRFLEMHVVCALHQDIDGGEVCMLGVRQCFDLFVEGGDHAVGGVDADERADVGGQLEGEQAGAAADFEDAEIWSRISSSMVMELVLCTF